MRARKILGKPIWLFLSTSREAMAAVFRAIRNIWVKFLIIRVIRGQARAIKPVVEQHRFIIVRYRYYSQNRALGDSTEKFMVDDTLKAFGQIDFDTIFWDDAYTFLSGADQLLIEKIERHCPSAIILSSYNWSDYRHFRKDTLEYLRRKGINLVAIWWDTCSKGFLQSVEPLLPLIDVHVVPDNPCLVFLGNYRQYFLPLWVTLAPAIYNNPGVERDIEISFLGQVGSYRSNRKKYVQRVVDANLPIYLSTSERLRQPSHNQYVETLKRSKIGLNFSYSVDAHQLKARVFETMLCGAMLMESENPQTRCYFTPMEDYVSFDSENDLVDKLRYYLEHEDERAEIAARGEKKVRELYNPVEFWKAITARLH